MKKKMILVQNTHWDYEWYFTVNQSNALFHFHMKELLYALDNDLIENYVLDGQTSIIESYLDLFPEDRDKVIKYNKSGKLKIGPWYTQTDQMIISTESIIKNLLIGHQQSEELGGAWKMAYAPDIFGHAENMPTIYNGFGIDKFVFWRGLNPNTYKYKEFKWVGNDGSFVETYNIKEGYTRAPHVTNTDEESNQTAIREMNEDSLIDSSSVYSMGSDQRHIDLDIRDKVKLLNEKYPEYEFVLGNYEDYFEQYKDIELVEVKGEFLDASNSKIHRSIYSHRYDHKRLNDYVERLTTFTLEPLKAMAAKAGITTLLNTTEEVWKLLLMNSAHDSAGGCNSDITNHHITNRFLKAKEITESYIDIIIRKIVEKAYVDEDIVLFNSKWKAASGDDAESNDLVLFNTTPYDRDTHKDVVIISKHNDFKIFDETGTEIEYDVTELEKVYSGSIVRTFEERDPSLYYYKATITLKTKVAPYSFKGIEVRLKQTNNNDLIETSKTLIENDKYSVEFVGGKFNITNKSTNETYNDYISFIAEADDGDTYDFSPLINGVREVLEMKNPSVKHIDGSITKTLDIDFTLDLKSGLDTWLGKESKTISQKFNLKVSLIDNRIDFKMETTNKVDDLRLRIKFNTNIKYDKSVSDSHFNFVERPIIQPEMETWKDLGWFEEPTGIYPMISSVIAKDENKQNTFLSNGIKEYEFYEGGDVELTLYRTIGWLGKPDLLRRPGIASGQQYKWIETPESQLHNVYLDWEFSILMDDLDHGAIQKERIMYSTEHTFFQDQNLDRFTGPLRYFVINKCLDDVEKDSKLFEELMMDKGVVVSILKQHSEKEILIRYYNATDELIQDALEIKFSKEVDVWESNLLEEKNNKLDNRSSYKKESMKPGEVNTIIISL